MKKITSLILALILALSVSAGAMASTPVIAGSPDFDVVTLISADSLTVYQGEPVDFTAVTTFTSNKNDKLWLQYVSDSWAGTDNSIPATETEIAVSAEPAADTNERLQVFTASASVNVSDEPGEYIVRVTYSITLQHDFSGIRTYKTVTTSACFPVDVLEGKADTTLTEDAALTDDAAATDAALTQEGLLNPGQIVSAWSHWKQTVGSENYSSGGPGVYRSLNWYKTQVEGKEFSSDQEVYDYLNSIYQPQNLHDNSVSPVNDQDIPSDSKDNPSDDNANSDKDKP